MPTKPKVEEVVNEPNDTKQYPMTEMFRKVLLATIGAAAMAQEELEAFVNKLVERGEIAERDGKTILHEMMDKRKHKTMRLEEDISKNVADVLERMNIPSKADVDALSIKITALSKKIDELKTPKQP